MQEVEIKNELIDEQRKSLFELFEANSDSSVLSQMNDRLIELTEAGLDPIVKQRRILTRMYGKGKKNK